MIEENETDTLCGRAYLRIQANETDGERGRFGMAVIWRGRSRSPTGLKTPLLL